MAEALENEEVQSEEVGGTKSSEEIPAFFDLNTIEDAKVREMLAPSHKEMQGAWSKKINEEVVPYREAKKFLDEYGGREELEPFLQSFTTKEGLESLFFELAAMQGLSEEQVRALMSDSPQSPGQDPSAPSPQTPDVNRPLTQQDLFRFQEDLETQRREEAELNEVRQELSSLKLSEEDERLVAYLAFNQPKHLGYKERIKKGHEQFQTRIRQRAAEANEKTAEGTKLASLDGAASTASEQKPTTWAETRRAALERLNAAE